MEATFYATEGEIIKVSPRNGKDFKLEELYTLLGCDYIEVLRLDDKNIVVIDEEGKLNGRPVNYKATALCHEKNAIFDWDCIVGPAIVCHTKMLK